MRRETFPVFVQITLDTLTTVEADGTISVNVILTSHGNATRTVKGKLDHKSEHVGMAPYWAVYDEDDRHTGIIEKRKGDAVRRFADGVMAQMATWALNGSYINPLLQP